MELVRKENKGLKITLIIFQVIWLIGYLGMTIFSLGLGVRDYLSMKANPDAGHNGMAFVLVVALVGSVTYGIVTGIGLINLVLSIKIWAKTHINPPIKKASKAFINIFYLFVCNSYKRGYT